MRVLLVDRHSSRLSTLRAVIADAGFDVVAVVPEDADLYAAVDQLAPDALIVSADCSRAMYSKTRPRSASAIPSRC